MNDKQQAALADIDRVLTVDSSTLAMNQPGRPRLNGRAGHVLMVQECISRYTSSSSYFREAIEGLWTSADLDMAMQYLLALRHEIAAGVLGTMESQTRISDSKDILEQADLLNQPNFSRRAAAVLAGAALEQYLHLLCDFAGIPTSDDNGKRLSASRIAQDLRAASVYDKTAAKELVSMQGIRNRACHPPHSGEEEFLDDFDTRRVGLFIDSVREFISRGYEKSISITPHSP